MTVGLKFLSVKSLISVSLDCFLCFFFWGFILFFGLERIPLSSNFVRLCVCFYETKAKELPLLVLCQRILCRLCVLGGFGVRTGAGVGVSWGFSEGAPGATALAGGLEVEPGVGLRMCWDSLGRPARG